MKNRLWCLTGNDQTLAMEHLVTLSNASGHNLSALMTIEIGRSAFEAGDTWQKSEDRTLGSCVRSIRLARPVALISQ